MQATARAPPSSPQTRGRGWAGSHSLDGWRWAAGPVRPEVQARFTALSPGQVTETWGCGTNWLANQTAAGGGAGACYWEEDASSGRQGLLPRKPRGAHHVSCHSRCPGVGGMGGWPLGEPGSMQVSAVTQHTPCVLCSPLRELSRLFHSSKHTAVKRAISNGKHLAGGDRPQQANPDRLSRGVPCPSDTLLTKALRRWEMGFKQPRRPQPWPPQPARSFE